MRKLLLSMIAAVFAIGMNATVVVTNATSGEWEGGTDGYTATINGYKISYLQHNSTNKFMAPSDDHIRVYKNGMLVIEAVDGSAITSLEITCTGANYAFDIVVADGDAKKDGATIKWTGNTTKFEGVTSNGQCRIKSIKINEGTTEPEEFNPAGTGEGTVESPYDVTRALDIITHEKYTNDAVYVKGTISTVTDLSLQYGNATYNISVDGSADSPQLVIYRGYSLGGEKFTSEDEIQDGDEVVVCGKLVNYNGTPEVTTGSSIYSINGKTATGTEPEQPEEPYVAVGDGSEANPYTVADIIGLNIETSDKNKYWVKGYILGTVDNGKLATTAEKYAATNLALGATADAETFIPVELPKGDIRTNTNVVDHADHVGKEALVYGTLEKYFGTAGVKNVTEVKIDGVPVGISTVKAAGETGVVYDLNGRRVSEMSRGLYIIDGKKVIK